MNILGKRYFFFGLSLVIIIPGLIILFTGGLPLSIDFTGGSLLEVSFANKSPEPAEIITIYDDVNIKDVQVQTTETGSYVIRSEFLDNEARDTVLSAMTTNIAEPTVVRFDSVGPSIGAQVTSRGAQAVALSSILVVLFIAWSFRGVENAFRYGISAILAMLHDVAIIFSITAVGGLFFGWEIELALPDRPADCDRLFDAGLDRGVRPHPRKRQYLPPPGLRNAGQPFHHPDPAAFDQHPADDRGIPAAGTGSFRRRDLARVRGRTAGRPDERDVLVHFHCRAYPGVVGKQGMENLVPPQGSHGVKDKDFPTKSAKTCISVFALFF